MDMRLVLPDDLYAQIQEVAKEEGNSVETQVVIAIEESIERRKVQKARQDAPTDHKEDA